MNAEYWDTVAKKKAGYHLESHIAQYKKQEHIDLLSRWCGDLNGKRVLKTDLYEEAFGADSFVPWISSHDAVEIVGIDISPLIVEKARSNMALSSIECVVSDVCQTPFQNENFDIIISNSTLDNMEKGDHVRALKELKRLLRPSGVLVLTLDNAHNPLYCAGYYISKFFGLSSYYQCKCFTVSGARKLIEKSGLVICDKTAIVHVPTPFNKLALIVSKIKSARISSLIERALVFFRGFRDKKTRYVTGWFLAFKVIKDDKKTL